MVSLASLDHPASTYDDKGPFAQTLWHRPLDQQFVARVLGGDHAIIGYSMGGYGALVAAGAGVVGGPAGGGLVGVLGPDALLSFTDVKNVFISTDC